MHRQLSGRDSNHFGKGIIQISGVNFPHRGLRGRAAAGLRVSTPGSCARRIGAFPGSLCTHTVRESTPTPCAKSLDLRLKSVESSFDVPSGRRFPHKMSGNVGRWMTTEFHTVPRTLMTPVQRRVSTPAHGRRNLRLRLASCPHLVSHARWKKGRKQVSESRNVNQTCFWRKSNFPPGASQLSGRVLTHFNRN